MDMKIIVTRVNDQRVKVTFVIGHYKAGELVLITRHAVGLLDAIREGAEHYGADRYNVSYQGLSNLNR